MFSTIAPDDIIVTFDPADPTKGFSSHKVLRVARKRVYVEPLAVSFAGLQGNPTMQGFYAEESHILAVNPTSLDALKEQFDAMFAELDALEDRYAAAATRLVAEREQSRIEIIENLKSALAPKAPQALAA